MTPVDRQPAVEPIRHPVTLNWPFWVPTCHEYGCLNAATLHVRFEHYEEYRCANHDPRKAVA